VLVTKGTRDEAYYWTAYHKEKRMSQNLSDDVKQTRLFSASELREDSEKE
jgi:ERCC4-related helicase